MSGTAPPGRTLVTVLDQPAVDTTGRLMPWFGQAFMRLANYVGQPAAGNTQTVSQSAANAAASSAASATAADAAASVASTAATTAATAQATATVALTTIGALPPAPLAPPLTAEAIGQLDFSNYPTSNPGGGRLWLSSGNLHVGP